MGKIADKLRARRNQIENPREYFRKVQQSVFDICNNNTDLEEAIENSGIRVSIDKNLLGTFMMVLGFATVMNKYQSDLTKRREFKVTRINLINDIKSLSKRLSQETRDIAQPTILEDDAISIETLPSSGPISMNDVNVELGKAGTDTITLNDSEVRDLAGIVSGTISLFDLYGTTAGPEVQISGFYKKPTSGYVYYNGPYVHAEVIYQTVASAKEIFPSNYEQYIDSTNSFTGDVITMANNLSQMMYGVCSPATYLKHTEIDDEWNNVYRLLVNPGSIYYAGPDHFYNAGTAVMSVPPSDSYERDFDSGWINLNSHGYINDYFKAKYPDGHLAYLLPYFQTWDGSSVLNWPVWNAMDPYYYVFAPYSAINDSYSNPYEKLTAGSSMLLLLNKGFIFGPSYFSYALRNGVVTYEMSYFVSYSSIKASLQESAGDISALEEKSDKPFKLVRLRNFTGVPLEFLDKEVLDVVA